MILVGLAALVPVYWPDRVAGIFVVLGLVVIVLALILLALAIPLPFPLVVCAAFSTGFGIEIFGVLWDTAMQQEIPPEKLSRMYSYDALGSFVFIPAGLAAAGPIAEVVGVDATLVGCAACIAVASVAVLGVRDVRTMARRAA